MQMFLSLLLKPCRHLLMWDPEYSVRKDLLHKLAGYSSNCSEGAGKMDSCPSALSYVLTSCRHPKGSLSVSNS